MAGWKVIPTTPVRTRGLGERPQSGHIVREIIFLLQPWMC